MPPTTTPIRPVGRRLLLTAAMSVAAVTLLDTAVAVAAAEAPRPSVAPVSVSLSAPRSVAKGEVAVLGVAVSAPDTRLAVAGATVVLDRRAAGTRGWREAGRSVTGPRGHAVFSLRIRSSQDFRARALPNAFFSPGRSGVLRVRATG